MVDLRSNVLFLVLILTSTLFGQGFDKLSPKESGINFTNQLIEDDTLNGLSYLYLYNGGGVAVGDINNDGLEDIYFTGNQVDDKLYLNKGNLQFKDVTKKYLKNGHFDFHTGVTMVDINNDGWLDIYVSCGGPAYDGNNRRNKLYINEGGKSFTNRAEEYGLDDSLNTTQSVFFDADLDGDLDVYLLNHIYKRKNTQYFFQFNQVRQVSGADKLLINENGKFVDKTKESGIISLGYGLGVVVIDVNNDFYPDIYVTNDFDQPDKLFINNGKGKFFERIKSHTSHISLFSMGVDAGDINNDGWLDILVADMASEDHVRSKKNMSGMSRDNFWNLVREGKHYQYMFNTLQLNIGGSFIEIGQMAGVANTDWSWATLLADFDNDGFQDIFIGNGYVRDLRDNDFKQKYDSEIENSKTRVKFADLQKMIPATKLANYIFQNNGDLTFSKKSEEWGLSEKINVSGAVYSDLDNDGDLDLICNALNDPSFILRNDMSEKANYLSVSLKGKDENIQALGATVKLYSGDKVLFRSTQTVRGFQSSVSPKIHFGIGGTTKIDSVEIYWNNEERTVLRSVGVNQLIQVDFDEGALLDRKLEEKSMIFVKTKVPGIHYVHEELEYNDFEKEVLLPHKMSQLGPFINVGDANMDGRTDIFIGGARGLSASLYLQANSGEFLKQDAGPWKDDIHSEDMTSVFADFDNDGDNDLFVVSGGNEAPLGHTTYEDRLYINDGNGHFKKNREALPEIQISGQKALAEDVNKDGWIDLIVFGRQLAGAYPSPADSKILINREGVFEDETKTYAPEFKELGMVTDAIYIDVDNDMDKDFVIVGEWMPVTIFENLNGKFKNTTIENGLEKTVGWWNSIDLYKDDKNILTFVLGNLGENNKFHPSEENPFEIYMNDFDDNGTNDIVLAKSQEAILYPVRGRQCSSEQMPFILDKFTNYDDFASADVPTIYSEEKLHNAMHYEVTTFSNSYLNVGNGKFFLERMPSSYQTGPINKTIVNDFDQDGLADIICVGNKYEAEVETIRYDGNPGYYMNGTRDFSQPVPINLRSNIKSAALITTVNGTYILLGVNKGRLDILTYVRK